VPTAIGKGCRRRRHPADDPTERWDTHCGALWSVLNNAEFQEVAWTETDGQSSRRGLGIGASLLLPAKRLFAQPAPLLRKQIPSSGEMIPIIGIGTARRYEDVKDEGEKVPLRETIK